MADKKNKKDVEPQWDEVPEEVRTWHEEHAPRTAAVPCVDDMYGLEFELTPKEVAEFLRKKREG